MTSLLNDKGPNKYSMNRVNSTSYFSEENISIEETLAEIQSSLQVLELNYLSMRKEWKKFSNFIEFSIERIEKMHKRSEDEYALLSEERLVVIREQARALKAFRLASIKARVKNYWRPRLGSLHHYPARQFKVKKHYSDKINLSRTPLISIVTPSYNQACFIERTIRSVLNQEYSKLEYIIQDGNSRDRTIDIISKYSNELKHWESKDDSGQSNALNLGFNHAQGEIMAYLNSDDMLLPGTLDYVANYFNENPDVDVIYGHRVLINEEDQEIGRWVLPPHDDKVLPWADYIPQETLFWRKRIWDKTGAKIDESFKFAMDWDLLLRFAEAGAVFKRVPRFLGAFRVHTAQKTSAKIASTGLEEMKRLRLRCHGRHVTYYEIKKNLAFYLVKHIVCHKLYKAGILRY